MKEIEWSSMRYDLKTALDIVDLPCDVKTTRYLRNKRTTQTECQIKSQLDAGTVIRLEKRLRVYYVKARVLKLDKRHVINKAPEFVTKHKLHVGKEILIPLQGRTRVRLVDKTGERLYHTVREVAEDFPSYVRAEQDTVCVAPGSRACEVVTSGTVLQLDRVTLTSHSVRGFRETFLICRCVQTKRELAFRLISTVCFRKVPDRTKYFLQDFIEHMPLPQVVEVVDVIVSDVIPVSDEDKADLLAMLGGPLELISLQFKDFIVGFDHESENIIAIPEHGDFLESALVNIPINDDVFLDTQPSGDNDSDGEQSSSYCYESTLAKLYLLYAYSSYPILLNKRTSNGELAEDPGTSQQDQGSEDLGTSRHDKGSEDPGTSQQDQSSEDPGTSQQDLGSEDPGTSQHDQDMHASMKHTLSAPVVGGTQGKGQVCIEDYRQRVSSAGDAEGHIADSTMQAGGLRSYLLNLSRRMKVTAVQKLFRTGSSQARFEEQANKLAKSSPDLSHDSCKEVNKETSSNFVCYLNYTPGSVDNGELKSADKENDNKPLEIGMYSNGCVNERERPCEKGKTSDNALGGVKRARTTTDTVEYATLDFTEDIPGAVHFCDICKRNLT
ncbi:hypothetical protein MAR_016300 [Mya arenaria]|uniref:CABIT domain-containing protein n=1 Tax=Mya arenaria TaxID=6604 RepID=A0ABY7FNM0_MYAAR|nr:uncharacterized protein LOC128212320 [Mya arenaria]XP_052773676.1 uncharacterized protein LOC128212320 [Mya arenaria]XP_052773677.1 uncharacterized protein LOC128212320 [Mya arenaria]XP_052773678.1 uncharacterized protein LOC128212320 [Mya arenaria]WAR22326.1 hypothetical protein MAR_016300 [Mya arenaria]